MAKRVQLSLILACYNQAPVFHECINRIVHTLSLSKLTYQLILVDDKSRDQTAKMISDFVKKDKRYKSKAIYHRYNLGWGRSVSDGMDKATGTVVGYIDIDCDISPVYIPEITDTIVNRLADVVVGRRVFRMSFGNFFYELLTGIHRFISNKFLDCGGVDTQSRYAFYNRKRIMPLVKKAKYNNIFFTTELVIHARMLGFKIARIPVAYRLELGTPSFTKAWTNLSESFTALFSLWRKVIK